MEWYTGFSNIEPTKLCTPRILWATPIKHGQLYGIIELKIFLPRQRLTRPLTGYAIFAHRLKSLLEVSASLLTFCNRIYGNCHRLARSTLITIFGSASPVRPFWPASRTDLITLRQVEQNKVQLQVFKVGSLQKDNGPCSLHTGHQRPRTYK